MSLCGADRVGRFSFEILADRVLPGHDSAPMQVQLEFHPSMKVTPSEMLEALDWADALVSPNRVEFELDGAVLFATEAGEESFVPGELRSVVADLAEIERATRPFGLPDRLELMEADGSARPG